MTSAAPDRVPTGGAPGLLDWAGVLICCACALLAGLLETLLVPFYIGTHVVPIAVFFALVSNVMLPRLAHRLVRATPAAALPFLIWLVIVVVFGVLPRPEGDVILPGGDTLQWVSYGMLLGGALAGAVTLVMIGGSRTRPSSLSS